MEPDRKYELSWDLLGDLQLERPNQGPHALLEVYRLMRYCFRDVIEKSHGTKEADRIFYEAGFLAGQHFYADLIGPLHDPNEFLAKQRLLKELKIGVLRLEEDPDSRRLVLSVSEQPDSSGLPEQDCAFSAYDEGFVAALVQSFTSRKFVVKEVDCWCAGDRTCRFSVQVAG